MRPRPDAAQLLEAARQALRGEVLAALPDDKRYQALMIANAMAIAARVVERGDAPEREELERLARLMGTDAALPANAAAVRERLNELHGRLCDELRAGTIAPGGARHRALFDHLRRATVERLRESNPKALPKNG